MFAVMPASDDAAIRASYAKTVIATMKRRPTDERDELLARLNPSLRRDIRERSLLDWIPASQFAALVTVIAEVLGPARAKAFWRANLLGSLERTLLSPLRLGALGLYGDLPSSLLRMTPHAWQLVSRNCGQCQTSDEPPSGYRLQFTGLPSELSNPAMCLLWCGGSESCIEHLRFTGSADAETQGLGSGTATIHVRWEKR
jgi:hypothetical protein